ncbi:MAG: zinc-binding alcohol dehydrogenase family protein, partial [Terriglobus roseus]|nr:zinc-binding alcohol dehydrogenase family protein [Terriglobus roseus]
TILGEDAAGKVVEVGSKLKHKFHVGQRIMAHTLGIGQGSAFGGFQMYPVVNPATAAAIPDDVSFAEAAVLPLSISTAAAGLFTKVALRLVCPTPESATAEPPLKSKQKATVLVWGGSSSVGSSCIQLAAAAGYKVITTASPSNYTYCKDLGASLVLDYHNPDVVLILIGLMRGMNVIGAYDAIGTQTTGRQCATIIHFLRGGRVATVGSAPDIYRNVKIVRISSGHIVTEEPDVAEKIWGKYVPWALKEGKLKPSPAALVAGKGLDSVQAGLDRQRAGVSAKKVVIELQCK